MQILLFLFLTIAGTAFAQLPGNVEVENHPALQWSKCDSSGCNTINGTIVVDAEQRWLHFQDGFSSCFQSGIASGGQWNDECRNNDDKDYCSKNCMLEGVSNYKRNYGIAADGHTLAMNYYTYQDFSDTVNNRVYLVAEGQGQEAYEGFVLMDNEIAFDVDLSKVPCGLNAALRFLSMDLNGGKERYAGQKAGVKYGTGFCDAQCWRGLRWVGDKAQVDWIPSATDPVGGLGPLGACCPEMSLWNSNANAYMMASKPCEVQENTTCVYKECGPEGTFSGQLPGLCDKQGCDSNPYRLGHEEFFGPGKTVDTNRSFTVVTQFKETAVTQFFIQDGKKIATPESKDESIPASTGIDLNYCDHIFDAFNERNRFIEVGGFEQHNDMLRRPLVLSMSIYDNHFDWNTWLDSTYPLDLEGQPGAKRGPCNVQDSNPRDIKARSRNAAVTFSNIRYGAIGTTVHI